MIDIDPSLLIDDMRKTAKELSLKHSKKIDNSFFKRHYDDFSTLNETLAANYGYAFDEEEIFSNCNVVDDAYNQVRHKEVKKMVDFFNQNQYLILDLANNLLNIEEEIGYQEVPFYNKVRLYSQKDFVDIILSFYDSFGNDTYNMMKKYFDENRISMGSSQIDEEPSAYCVPLQWLKTAYIFCMANQYSSYTASVLCHELGHAYDLERTFFSQQKLLSQFSDFYIEVPSHAFETSFYYWLKENKIDVDGSEILINFSLRNTLDHMLSFHSQISKEELTFDEDGKTISEDKQVYPTRDNILYGLGLVFSYNLNYIRQNDPKEFIKVLDNIITLRKESTLEQTIERMGMSVDDFVSCKYIKDDIKNEYLTLKKKYKL